MRYLRFSSKAYNTRLLIAVLRSTASVASSDFRAFSEKSCWLVSPDLVAVANSGISAAGSWHGSGCWLALHAYRENWNEEDYLSRISLLLDLYHTPQNARKSQIPCQVAFQVPSRYGRMRNSDGLDASDLWKISCIAHTSFSYRPSIAASRDASTAFNVCRSGNIASPNP